MNTTEFAYFVIVNRTGIVVRCVEKNEVFKWLDDDGFALIFSEEADAWSDEEKFQAAIDTLNADGWHVSVHKTEDEALAVAKAGITCHGKWYAL